MRKCIRRLIIKVHRDPSQPHYSLSQEEWISVLKLSTLWDFFAIRETVIREMLKTKMTAMSMILLGRQFSVKNWLLTGYVYLVKAPNGMSMQDAETIGLRQAVKIFQLREENQYRRTGIFESSLKRKHRDIMEPSYCEKCNLSLTSAVRQSFKDELGEDEEAEKADTVSSCECSSLKDGWGVSASSSNSLWVDSLRAAKRCSNAKLGISSGVSSASTGWSNTSNGGWGSLSVPAGQGASNDAQGWGSPTQDSPSSRWGSI